LGAILGGKVHPERPGMSSRSAKPYWSRFKIPRSRNWAGIWP